MKRNIIKYLSATLITVIMIFMVGCGNSERIVGTWNCYELNSAAQDNSISLKITNDNKYVLTFIKEETDYTGTWEKQEDGDVITYKFLDDKRNLSSMFTSGVVTYNEDDTLFLITTDYHVFKFKK